MKMVSKLGVTSNLFALAILVILALQLGACGGGPVNGSSAPSLNMTPLPACTTNPAPSFAQDIAPIINVSCVGCHSAFSSYQSAFADSANIAIQVNSLAMPKVGSLSTTDRNLIVEWAVCGALN